MADLAPRPLRPGLPDCPDYLDSAASDLWRRLSVILWQDGRLNEATIPLLAAFCTACSIQEHASKVIRAEGPTIRAKSGRLTAHPMVKVEQRAAGQLLRLAIQLGLTPLSRAKLRQREEARPSVSGGSIA